MLAIQPVGRSELSGYSHPKPIISVIFDKKVRILIQLYSPQREISFKSIPDKPCQDFCGNWYSPQIREVAIQVAVVQLRMQP